MVDELEIWEIAVYMGVNPEEEVKRDDIHALLEAEKPNLAQRALRQQRIKELRAQQAAERSQKPKPKGPTPLAQRDDVHDITKVVKRELGM